MRLAYLAALAAAGAAAAADPFADARRVVFLGDSNTFAGRFIAYLDAHQLTQFPDRKVELINLGLPSETVSGLSEPDHPYPRPTVHDRLAAVLAKAKPDVVVACYGMNDGIYYPFDDGRFRRYQDGYRKLIAECEKAGAKVVLMTPAPFDPAPLQGKVLPKGAEKYGWLQPYEEYDEVLTRYSDWLLTFREKGYVVADAHTAVLGHLARMRKAEPAYRVSGDGIHPSANGHFVIYKELVRALGLPGRGTTAEVDAAAGKSATPGVTGLAVRPGRLELTWSTRAPFPRDPAWHRRLADVENVAAGAGQFRLAVTGLPVGRHALYEGDRLIGAATADEWKSGVDLGRWPDLTANRRAAEVWKLLEEKTRVLGLAWLTDVGHKRPDTPKGIALAEAQMKAADLDAKARELAGPIEMKLRIVPEAK
jgi:lysophospholipase L1-like esterase